MVHRRAESAEPAGEDELIGWLRRRTARRGGRWIGDDAAILPEVEQWAVTMDSQVEGVHFFAGLDPAIVARRLLAVNLSDLAAMGAEPSYGFLALLFCQLPLRDIPCNRNETGWITRLIPQKGSI